MTLLHNFPEFCRNMQMINSANQLKKQKTQDDSIEPCQSHQPDIPIYWTPHMNYHLGGHVFITEHVLSTCYTVQFILAYSDRYQFCQNLHRKWKSYYQLTLR